MASSQSRNGGTGDPLKRTSSSANSRSETASVSSRAGKVDAAQGGRQRLEQIALALPAPPAHHPQRGSGTSVGGKGDQALPLGVPVEQMRRLGAARPAKLRMTEV